MLVSKSAYTCHDARTLLLNNTLNNILNNTILPHMLLHKWGIRSVIPIVKTILARYCANVVFAAEQHIARER